MAGTSLQFTKMHGLGNDFVVIDAINQQVALSAEQCRYIADRRFGVGCDQILLVESPAEAARRDGVDFRYRIFNADGSEVAQCGNGARCFARFVREQGLAGHLGGASEIRVETANGQMLLIAHEDNSVTVDMGVPQFAPSEVPIAVDDEALAYTVSAPGHAEPLSFSAVNVGNPHAVLRVDNVDTAPVEELGPWLESHAVFPERANIGFMQLISPERFRLRVYERGSGETLACGSGACAAMAVGHTQGWLGPRATAELRGGNLQLDYSGRGRSVMMTGPTERVFDGVIRL